MESMTLKIEVTAALKAWLTATGKRERRTATGQGERLCEEYLKRAYQAAKLAQKNGATVEAHAE
jgi:hypothetical protein